MTKGQRTCPGSSVERVVASDQGAKGNVFAFCPRTDLDTGNDTESFVHVDGVALHGLNNVVDTGVDDALFGAGGGAIRAVEDILAKEAADMGHDVEGGGLEVVDQSHPV